MRSQSGFTLIEVLVAMAIFAVVSLVSYRIITFLSMNQDILLKKTEESSQIFRTMQAFSNDGIHFVHRGFRTPTGEHQGPLWLLPKEDKENGDWFLFLSRKERFHIGLVGEGGLERVLYRVKDKELQRAVISPINLRLQSYDGLPFETLLKGVEKIDAQIQTFSGESRSRWLEQTIPPLLSIKIKVQKQKEILFQVPLLEESFEPLNRR